MALIDGYLLQNRDQRKASLAQVHPVYESHVYDWRVALDAYDATGGFVSGAYLWKFAREEHSQFVARKAQARYQNYAETVVDTYVRHIMTGVTRETSDAGLADWWEDVTGRGTSVNDYLAQVLGQALAGGHAGILCDKAADRPNGPAVADDPNRPTLATFVSTAIRDWRYDIAGLAAVKLAEAPELVGLDEEPSASERFLLWDRELWIRLSGEGDVLESDTHDLGRVPLVMLRPKPSRMHDLIGKPLLPPSVLLALFNRASEEDLVLRDQAFSLFVVQVPVETTADEIDRINKTLNTGVGTTTAITVPGSADFRTADMAVPQTLQKHQLGLVQELWRAAHMRFQRDSLEAESAEAIRLQRQDLDQALRGMSEDMQKLEERIARLYFAWTSSDGDRAFDAADVQVQYPTEFSLVDIEAEITSLQAAMAMSLGRTAEQELKKRAVRIMLPDLSDDTLDAVREEIEQAPESGADGLRRGAVERLRGVGVEVEEPAA